MMTQNGKTNRLRVWSVRGALIAILLLVFGGALYVHFHDRSLQGGCGSACYTDRYPVRDEIRTVALTFDDGPAGAATDSILATLEEYDAPATFFLVGENIYEHPDQVKAIAAAGHIIGNHTYTSDDTQVHESRARIEQELNDTNALIESLTGRSAVLYRPPSLIDLEPFEVLPPPGRKEVWDWVYDAGYVPVGVDFDSNDWQAADAEDVVEQVREQLMRAESGYYGMHTHVVLLHDLPQTAEALPSILTMLRHEGYEVVPLTDLIGVPVETAMPPAPDVLYHLGYRAVLAGSGVFLDALFVVAFMLSLVGFARVFVFTSAKLGFRRADAQSAAPLEPYRGGVTVLIPAYNEEANIASTIRSVLNNTRRPDEVLVIDDGSRDATTRAAQEVAAEFPGLVRVITKHNGGKASALNLGVHVARNEVIVAIDGDTVLDPGCIEALVRPFGVARIGAVAGKVMLANSERLLERYQLLEYVVGQNVDKEVVSALGSVHIVPGAVGAWRRDAIQAVGGYSTDTLVEDQDLTFALLEHGYGVIYTPDAIVYTEVPQTTRAFYLQRFRWTYGTFQCIWKYRRHLMDDKALRLSWISLPYAFVFNVVMPVLSLLLLMSIVSLALLGVSHPSMWMFLTYLVADLVYAYVGVRDDASVPTTMVWLVVLQHFVYIAIYVVIIGMVLLKILDGTPTRWNKLARTGAANAFFASGMSQGSAPTGVV